MCYTVSMNSNPCLNCGGDVATGPGRTGKFCGSSCAAKYNNSRRPKKRQVCDCGRILDYRSKSCRICRSEVGAQVTLGELREKSVRHAQVYNTLRQRSRKIAQKMGLTGCEVCGYSTHVEIAHINALSKLSDSTTVAEASDHTNFRLLCPNHHWELDNGMLPE